MKKVFGAFSLVFLFVLMIVIAILGYNYLSKNYYENQVENQTENQVENQTENQSENQLENQSENQSENQAGNQLGNQVESQPDEQSENQTQNQVANHGAQVANQSTVQGKEESETSEIMTSEPIGPVNTAADFSVTNRNGETVHLSDYFGKPIIINFWATWCGPCKSELPSFNTAYEEHGEEITFLMVNLTDGYSDTVTGVNNFLDTNGYSFPVYYDEQAEGAAAYQISSIPLTVLIDKDGNVLTSHIGAMDEATLNGYIDTLLAD